MRNFLLFLLFLAQVMALDIYAQGNRTVSIEAVSVDSLTNNTRIFYSVSVTNLDTVQIKYIPHNSQFGGELPIDTFLVPGPTGVMLYTDSVYGSPDSGVVAYQVYIMYRDANGDLTDFPASKHRTIFAELLGVDRCEKRISLKWTAYSSNNGTVNPTGYAIYRQGNGAYELVGTVDGNTLEYTDSVGVGYGIGYHYLVRATLSNGYFANSNTVRASLDSGAKPSPFQALQCTVDADNRISLSFNTGEPLNRYVLLRQLPTASEFAVIDSFSTAVSDYVDVTAFAGKGIINYKLGHVNSCGDIDTVTDVLHNYYLETYKLDSVGVRPVTVVELVGGLDSMYAYSVFRYQNGTGDEQAEMIMQLDSAMVYDDLSDLVYDESAHVGSFCYYVAITGATGEVRTNTACVSYGPYWYFPTALKPNSTNADNRLFKPQVSFVLDYHLVIKNRWGNVVFESNDPAEAWDGTYNGELVPEGAYVYLAVVGLNSGSTQKKTGVVSVVY